MSSNLPKEKKIAIVRKIAKGKEISNLARVYGVSRTTIYAWKRIYASAMQPISLKANQKKTKNTLKEVRINQKKILEVSVHNPSFSLQKGGERTGVSTYTAWKTLPRHNLGSFKRRLRVHEKIQRQSKNSFNAAKKLEVLKAYQNGMKVTEVSKKFGISRTTFYKLKDQYTKSRGSLEGLKDKRARGNSHYRFKDFNKSIILEVVIKNPEFSVREITAWIRKHTQNAVSTFYIYGILKEYGCTSSQQRYAYSSNHKNSIIQNNDLIRNDSSSLRTDSTFFVSQKKKHIPIFLNGLLFPLTLIFVYLLSLQLSTIVKRADSFVTAIKHVVYTTAGSPRNISGEMSKQSYTVTGNNPYSIDLPEEKSATQNFKAGVLAINTDSNLYSVGETVHMNIGYLDPKGKTICGGNLEVVITDPEGQMKTYATADQTISVSNLCGSTNPDSLSDYELDYKTVMPGKYIVRLHSFSEAGNKTIVSSFITQNDKVLDVSRSAATRIWPLGLYSMRVNLIAEEAFQGIIEEEVPREFIIQPQEDFSIIDKDMKRYIQWKVNLKAGDSREFTYTYDAPDISPDFYTLGALKIYDAKANLLYKEYKPWQLAIDEVGK